MAFIWNLFIFIVASTVASGEIVSTSSGSVEGSNGLSRDGRKYFSFYGVPYAEPPVGSLRLKNPVAIKPWEGIQNCKEPALPCIHVQGFSIKYRNLVLGSEDCLKINIFTPKLNPDKPLAVLVHIHGGGFMEGMPPPGAADYFMDEDVVLVTIQYRLGVLGFLSLEDEVLPGNFGLKDQALALAWIKSNIANFGGDPNRITIFGESAGGASVHYLMKSPLSKHLISGAISESGAVNLVWALAKKGGAKKRASKVAEIIGCVGTSHEILKCLQEADTEKLVRIKNSFYVWDFNPSVPLKPVVEKKGTKGAFITEDPLEITTNIPWITGFTTDEGAIVAGSLAVQSASIVEAFITNIDKYLPHVLCAEKFSNDVKKTTELLKEQYFSHLEHDSVINGLNKMVLEGLFLFPMLEALEKHNGPKYVYQFNYRGANTIIDEYGEQPKDLGVSHVDEILHLFNMSTQFPKVKESDVQFSKNLVKMWAKFAQDGKPSPDWKEWKKGEYILIGETNSMKNAKGLWEESATFWSNLPLFTKQADLKTEL